ncbi:MAG TPA: oligoendopeptidase F [Vicinamibacterales bacterium]|nr:oligoendopeptidase F [Vicinamibacterales bacterium]
MRTWLLTGVLVVSVFVASSPAQERERAKIPEKYKWDLTALYPSEAAWRAAKDKVQAELPEVGRFKGKLGASAATLAEALDRMTAVEKDLDRLSTYAGLLADQDTRDGQHQGMRQEMTGLRTSFGAESSYIQPEILRISQAQLQRFVASEPRLKIYAFYLENIARRAAHTLGDPEEKLLASVQPVSGSASTTFSVLSNAEFPYPTVTLSDGRTVKVDQAAFAALRALPTRSDREKVMSAFFGALGQFKGTFGTTMNGNVQSMLFQARARKYQSNLEARLDGPNIPVAVYSHLIEGVNRHLPTFHRYLRLRKRIIGVDELHYYDLYAPFVASANLEYTPEETQKNILAALAPLGPEYLATVRRALNERWIDLYPNEGKASGGYTSGGAYDVHPYLLLNYNGQYVDMSTLAHEMGHAMHSYLANKRQPYVSAGYPIFVAEVASLFNESLLQNYMTGQVAEKAARLSILGNYLEILKANVFRQTQFAEFELRMHEMAQRGESITGDSLGRLYLDITRRYYGHDQGVCIVDDYVAHEWSIVPHFYSPFYVFQYATSFTAATALSQKVMAGGQSGADATKRYLAFLGSGGSKYPVDLLKDAGVDMTTDEPLDLTIRNMNRVMDEMEQLIAL